MNIGFSHRVGPFLVLIVVFAGCSPIDEPPDLSGPYYGQEVPGSEPRLFMPGLISTNEIDHCVGFLDGGRVCVFSIREKGTYSSFEEGGRWSHPVEVPWRNERGATDFTVGPDGRTVYFQSSRLTGPGDERRDGNTWAVEWTGDGWTEPALLPPPVNTDEYSEWYPSVAPDGTVYFFSTTRPDSANGDIYRSRPVGADYLEAERLPTPVNSDYYEVDPVISPDGRYLLFGSGRPGGYDLLDLYVAFSTPEGRWTNPVNAGPVMNPFSIPTRMSITPDGRYYFFPSRQETETWKGEEVVSPDIERWGDVDVYWVDTSFVSELMASCVGKDSVTSVVAGEYTDHGVDSAAALLEKAFEDGQDTHYFEMSEFMSFLGDLLQADKGGDAERLYRALLEIQVDRFRLDQGYAVTCIMNGQTAKGLELLGRVWEEHPSRRSTDDFMLPFQLRMKGRTEDELAVLRFLASESPDSAFAHFDLAAALERRGLVDEALRRCRTALELRPSWDDAIRMQERLTQG